MSAKMKKEFLDAVAGGEFDSARKIMRDNNLVPTSRDYVRYGMSPLAYAIQAQQNGFAAELIAMGSDVNEFVQGDTPLVMLANAEGVDLLANAGADLNATLQRDIGHVGLSKGATALIKAAHHNDSAVAAKLLERGVDVNAADRLGRTALHYAAQNSRETADRLILAGADFMAKDRFGRAAMFNEGAGMAELAVVTEPAVELQADAQRVDAPLAAREALVGMEYKLGDRISVDHGEFLYLNGKNVPGVDLSFAVVPRTLALPVSHFKDLAELQAYLASIEIDEKQRRAVETFMALSQTQDDHTHDKIPPAPAENAIIFVDRPETTAAISLDDYIERIESGKGGDLGSEVENIEGPATLLRGRFVRDTVGQYRRIGEERVALVDEGDKIRFVDKQLDTFQAAAELANTKKWQTIQVTGTEQFRAEAWFAARLAGLEVQGYEPQQRDLDRLEQAVARGMSQRHDEPAPEVSRSRREAEDHALQAGRGLQQAQPDGNYKGKILHETDHHVVQDIGRKVAVVHEKAGFPAEALAQAKGADTAVRINYSRGKPALTVDKPIERGVSQGR